MMPIVERGDRRSVLASTLQMNGFVFAAFQAHVIRGAPPLATPQLPSAATLACGFIKARATCQAHRKEKKNTLSAIVATAGSGTGGIIGKYSKPSRVSGRVEATSADAPPHPPR